jgi:ABC-2 type transport system permease protein
MRKTLFQLTLIHFREFIREPGILFWSIIFPILMAWVLGVAFSKEPELIQTIALVETHADVNPLLVKFLRSSKKDKTKDGFVEYRKEMPNPKLGKSTYHFVVTDWNNAVLMLKRGQTNMIIVESKDSINYHFDPRNPEAKLGYIMLSGAIRNEDLLVYQPSIKPFTKVGTRYIDFLIPGLLALGLMNSLIWGISYGLIEMRVKRLLRRMVATPMKRSEFLISLFMARFALSTIEALILFTFGWFYFTIQIEGSIPALILVFISGNIAFAGISVLLSARVQNTRIGTGLINFIILPMTVLSGIFFSYHNFPGPVIPFIQILPLTMLADSIRSVFIEGAGLYQVIEPAFVLSSLGLVCFLIGLKIYKWY